jgi:G2/mitotic-specific cyclin 3/4
MMLECCEHPRLHHAAIFEKYSEKRFKEAAAIVQKELDAGFTLPQGTAPRRSTRSQPLQVETSSEHLHYQNHLLSPVEG